ncbi:MAG: NADH-quinone oxidoreductase subunit N [Deltaproteobacteria bacterium]|nr:NADH-quinone oxidoreductase subunit N [Deltaproteobacteria bacterium]
MFEGWPVIAPHAILALCGGLIFCLGAFWQGRPHGLLWWLALASALSAGHCALGGPHTGTYQNMLDVGVYGRVFIGLIALVCALALLLLRRYARERNFAGEELYGLMLLAALGMALTAGAVHWLIFFLGLELFSICLYILLAMRKQAGESLEAGLKYFILGAVASSLVIFGIALIYAGSGEMLIASSLTAATTQGQGSLILLGLGLVLTGLAFKLSLAPLHVWTPDVYQGAPAPLTAFLAAGSKTAVMAVLVRLCAQLPEGLWTYWVLLLWGLAGLTMLTANLSALRESRVKRLLAYSSAAQMGYLVMALVGSHYGGLSAALFFLSVYALMDMGVFGLVGVLSPLRNDLNRLEELRGLARRHPWLAGFLVLCLFSLAGMPPTGGFVGKLLLFTAVLKAGYPVLALLGALAAAIAFYYYFKVVAAMYLQELPGGPAPSRQTSTVGKAEALALAVIAAALLWLGVFPAWLHDLARAAVAALGG